jgi:hypothetical protein
MRRVSLLAVLAAALLLPAVTAFADPTLTAGTGVAKPGNVVTIPITLNVDAKSVSGVEFTLTSTASRTNTRPLAVAVDGFNLLPDALYDASLLAGTFHGAAVSAQPVNGPVTVLNLLFRVPSTATAGTTYSLKLAAKLNDPNGVPIVVKTADGTVTVQ